MAPGQPSSLWKSPTTVTEAGCAVASTRAGATRANSSDASSTPAASRSTRGHEWPAAAAVAPTCSRTAAAEFLRRFLGDSGCMAPPDVVPVNYVAGRRGMSDTNRLASDDAEPPRRESLPPAHPDELGQALRRPPRWLLRVGRVAKLLWHWVNTRRLANQATMTSRPARRPATAGEASGVR